MREKDLHRDIEEKFLTVYESVSKLSGEIGEIASTSQSIMKLMQNLADNYKEYLRKEEKK
ncbi:hypothetical protein GKZ28_06875 [Clostridium chromiireducens]|uniref:Uncharacterized protein n=1 Tax=Clostridium chromiireducens TaxID=225345 RepID=A0A964W1R2_9CLOT|nr:hypothetical protein [Clostridium chromiireducens]MVX63415.1 hypothetical protein [Clostridium chromiireducens]